MSVPIDVVRHPRARRSRLALDPATGRARLTLPPRASLPRALAWAEGQRGWLDAQRARLPLPQPFIDGAMIPFDDATLTVTWSPDGGRSVRRRDDRLVLGGPVETVGRRVEAWLRRAALMLLSDDTAHYAAVADVKVSRVAIGNARGRWGSCAASGAIRYNWRLALAPRSVRRATAAHEVAHRVHMNHGPAFHALVAELYEGDVAAARHWLRQHGASLHWFGRSPG